MKRVRITYPGAFHHAMNRGINGEKIFTGKKNKEIFLDLLDSMSRKLKIRILAYCLLDNHYHLILENSSGRMSDFFLHLNGQYGMIYRKRNGESGYVFQSRYKSTLIQEDVYLRQAIRYTLLNPVRAGLVTNFEDYVWSSATEYYSGHSRGIVDCDFVNELFESERSFYEFIQVDSTGTRELPLRLTRHGDILGDKKFEKSAFEKFNRRESLPSIGLKRIDDQVPIFESRDKVIFEFEKEIGMPVEDLRLSTHVGKRLRGELLVRLKDVSRLKYSEIIEIPPFRKLKLPSLGKIYRDAKMRIEMKNSSNR